MKRKRQQTRPEFVLILLLVLGPAIADDYGGARARLIEAYQASDYPAMISAAHEGLVARPAFPGGLYNLAFAHTLAGHFEQAFDALDQLAAMRIDYEIEESEAFAPLLNHARYPAYAASILAARQTLGEPDVAWQLSDGKFVPEGIAVVNETLFLGSIRKGTILRVEKTGESTQLLASGDTGSVFGMRFIDDDLWFAAARTDQFVGDSVHQTGLYRLDPATGKLHGRYPLPELDGTQTLGDLVEYDGDLITADQTDGRLYRFDRQTETYSVFLERGALRSPQGMVIDGDVMFVSDWNGGLFAMDMNTKELKRVDGITTSLYGIDGLYRHGDWLIAIQNGVRPNRVVALRLTEENNRVAESRILAMNHAAFDEPNLGVVANGSFYFVANSHWNRFDRDNNLPDDLSGPTILRVDLPDD